MCYFLIDVWHFDADGVLSVRTTSKFHFLSVPVLYNYIETSPKTTLSIMFCCVFIFVDHVDEIV
jgi:hypothetical protein